MKQKPETVGGKVLGVGRLGDLWSGDGGRGRTGHGGADGEVEI